VCYTAMKVLQLTRYVATMCPLKQSVVRARIDEDLKAEASAILESWGLGLKRCGADVLRQVVQKGGLPFPVRGKHITSANQLWKMKHAAQQRDRKLANQEGISAGEMLLISRAECAMLKWCGQ